MGLGDSMLCFWLVGELRWLLMMLESLYLGVGKLRTMLVK